MSELKPGLGEQVHYYDPSLVKKVGYNRGHGGRKDGPYLAWVTNDIGVGISILLAFPDYPPFTIGKLRGKDEVVAGRDEPYWDWTNPLQKARAQKRSDEKPAEPAAPARDTTKHPST